MVTANSKMRYTGCDDAQANYGHGADPRDFLQVGEVYLLTNTEVHDWHTLYYLKGYQQPFNSVCFEQLEGE